jgi:tetratricopeptide (TPR) repeat protein
MQTHWVGMRLRAVHVLTLLALVLFRVGFARAEQDIERAKQLFEEASSLRAAGQYGDALVRLNLALAIKETPGLHYHAGFCEANLGHYSRALEHYERAAALIRAGAEAPDVVALLNQAHRSALEHVAHLLTTLSKPVTGATLSIDNEPDRPLTGKEELVDPGTHYLRIRAPGYASEQRQVNVHESEVLQIQFSLSPLRSHLPNATGASSHPAWKTASIVAGLSVTALGLAAGIGGAIGHSNASASEQAALVGGETQAAQLYAARNDKDTYATLETAGFVTAGAGALTTVALWVFWPASKSVSVATHRDSMGSSSASVAVTTVF